MRRALTAIAVLVVLAAAVAAWTARTSTPPFTDSEGRIVPGSIAEERRMLLGGVEQYVLIRGRSRKAPILVFVHGGPGGSETAFLRTYNADLENDFVVVYWDQRGTGKSYDASLEPDSMTIARMTADLGELIDLLRTELEQSHVLLVAHSWGTILGLEHVAARPNTVAAYIGVTQIVDEMESDAEGYNWALAAAEDAGDADVLSDAEALGSPPYTVEEFWAQRELLNEVGGVFVEPMPDMEVIRTVLATPESAWPDLFLFFRGFAFSMEALWPEQQQYDARERHTRLEAPIFFFVGRHDHVISPRLSSEYLGILEAPDKDIVWFEHSAHMIPFEEPERFNEEVRRVARRVKLLAR